MHHKYFEATQVCSAQFKPCHPLMLHSLNIKIIQCYLMCFSYYVWIYKHLNSSLYHLKIFCAYSGETVTDKHKCVLQSQCIK